MILSRFQSLNFEGKSVCTLPLVFASESVTGSFLQLYHYLVYKVCISALRQQLIAVSKQSIEKIPPFPNKEYNNRPAAHTKDRFAHYRCTVPFCNPPKSYIRTYITVSRLPHLCLSCYQFFLPLLLPL